MDKKTLLEVLATLLIVVGIVLIVYEGYTYTKHEEVLRIGDLQVTAETKERVYISPIYGIASLTAGIVLILIVRRKG